MCGFRRKAGLEQYDGAGELLPTSGGAAGAATAGNGTAALRGTDARESTPSEDSRDAQCAVRYTPSPGCRRPSGARSESPDSCTTTSIRTIPIQTNCLPLRWLFTDFQFKSLLLKARLVQNRPIKPTF